MIIEIIIALITLGLLWWFVLRPAPPLASQDVSRFKPTTVIQTAPILRKTPVEKKTTPAVVRDKDKPFVKVFFGSQTGTAEDFAEEVTRDLEAVGVTAEVVDLEDYEVENFANEHAVLFMMATYGEGEPTDNGKEFWDWISTTEDLDMSHLNFGCFGLGNTTYEFYNWFGRQTNKKMLELGAKPFVTYGEGDDDSTLEDDFAAWRKTAIPEIVKFFGLSGEKAAVEYKFKTKVLPAPGVSLSVADSAERFSGKPNKSGAYDLHHPAYATISLNMELHTEKSDRSCRHVEIELPKPMTYATGDHLAVWPFNNTALVEQILKRLDIDPKKIFVLKSASDNNTLLGPISATQAFRSYVDLLSIPRKSLMEHLARYVTDEKEAEKFKSYYETGLYHSYIQGNHVSFWDLLREFPSLHVTLEGAMEFLPRLQPRYYSISSAPYQSEGGNVMVDITVAVVEFETPLKRKHEGVCSTWLSVTESDKVAVYIRSSPFKLPESEETPIIMIGPGTGLAPFRGFLQERASSGSSAHNVLFFGCRNADQDYIYQEELEKWHADGHVQLHTSFSRDGAEKDYVQHQMAKREVSGRLWDMVSKEDAKIYICGDANKMAKDVREQWLKIFQHEGGMTAEEAETYLEGLHDRYQQDTWS